MMIRAPGINRGWRSGAEVDRDRAPGPHLVWPALIPPPAAVRAETFTDRPGAYPTRAASALICATVMAWICAAVNENFRYLRWDDDKERYLSYPGKGALFEVVEL